ncbi:MULTISPECIES: FHA domain-containing protein [Clostridium]|uniref:FHA domain-containing protein n=1 Tax=Clostridium cibarium TaxID=2762247 RepID=A0ABR8PSI3_9CLOT|nr:MULTISPECIES: FHA domain-containing protein [Clostridium]MBD7911108.1 FHA domain-containing protein [Clostridium cibarium]
MDFSKFSAIVFGIAFIIILYVIIYFALKIMYKDVKGGGRRKRPQGKKSYGIEVLEVDGNENLKKGTVIPVRGVVTLGRKDDNSVILSDQHVSGNHARFVIKNNILFIEDLNSTNGTFVNGRKVAGKAKLFGKDEIKIGSTSFKVL